MAHTFFYSRSNPHMLSASKTSHDPDRVVLSILRIPSSVKDVFHDVERRNGTWTCTCGDYKYRREALGELCKHGTLADEATALTGLCTHAPQHTICVQCLSILMDALRNGERDEDEPPVKQLIARGISLE